MSGDLHARLAALHGQHQPRTWIGGTATVCGHCNEHWPCQTKRTLDGDSE